MGQIPPIFPVPAEAAIVTFDAVDFAEGSGIVKFWLFASKLVGGLDYHLGREVVYSGGAVNVTGSVDTKVSSPTNIDIDFDLTTFNLPRTIEGTATLQIGHAAEASGGGNEVGSTITARIRKWDGTTETEIANSVSEEISSSAVIINRIHNMPIVIPRTHFKIGETLRLSLDVTSRIIGGGGGVVGIGHDPQNRDGIFITPSTQANITATFILMPFRIDR